MVITHLIGGLGNQMFQYSAARVLSLKLGVQLRLDISSFANYPLHQGFELQRIFNFSSEVADMGDLYKLLGWQSLPAIKRVLVRPIMSAFRRKQFVTEPNFRYWSGINNLVNDCYLYGYWQSEQYFADFADKIREDFAFKIPFSVQNAEIAQQILQANAVSLHVRRGDYVSNAKNNFIGVCSLDYYQFAIEKINNQVDEPVFFIFSDDINWVKNNLVFDKTAVFVAHNAGLESYNDMRLMSLCKHNIIANSSFSWWGAWLNTNPTKIVIAPKRWFASKQNDSDLVPASWLRM